ncbi:5080c189-67d9-4346-8326-afc7daa73ebe-CDS [Sclerotinia trifoliorum]|uniref:5080c189-67d9-4346-8326-afc7daa73ebe-CDS n=1 Tax=Sclerotinia trifoliorum TaxID=28548 RepID=A0A8H2VNC5_9HELO|nr:5080c189-67d9-4346-8326-afc7daa73ebe-CDS [Sclerotinia trifoliorum]
MGNTSSHQPLSSSTTTPTPTSQTSSSNSSNKSPKHFHIHSNPFSQHFYTADRRASSIDEHDSEHGALLRDDGDIEGEEEDDGTYLLRRGSLESRDEWLARKRIIASRVRGGSESGSDGRVKMWKGCSAGDDGKGQF